MGQSITEIFLISFTLSLYLFFGLLFICSLSILKPIWTYGLQSWGSASNSNTEILERFQSIVLLIITDAPWYVPNAVIIRDLRVLSVRQEVRNYSVTHPQRLNDHPNSLAKSLFQRPNYNFRLKRYYPAGQTTRFNWYSAAPPQTIPNHLWLSLNRRCVSGCISYMPLIVTVKHDCWMSSDRLQHSGR